MGKLNIAHHKSYHPYRADNIERVKKDEEEARLKEALEDGRVSLADSEARLSLLRERANINAKPSKRAQEREEQRMLDGGNPLIASGSGHSVSKEKGEGGALTLTASSGHLNFFEELEYNHQNTLEHSGQAKTKADKEREREKELQRGVPLMPDAKDRNPWYLDKGLKHPKDMTDEEIGSKEKAEDEKERDKWGKRARGNKTSSKASLDPLKEIKTHLAARSQALSRSMPPPPPRHVSNSSLRGDASAERATRESSERARAEALIAKRRAEMEAASVSSSVGGDTPYSSIRDGGYSDVYNKKETREAHASWGRYSDRRWDDDRDDRRDSRQQEWSREGRRDRSEDSSRDHRAIKESEGERNRRHKSASMERARGTDSHKDLPRGERNRTRGVEDVRRWD